MFSLYSQFITELRNNTRLKMGLWLIAFILASYSLLLLHRYQQQLEGNYSEALNRLKHVQQIVGQTYWVERAASASDLRHQLEARIWQANSKGLAQAELQKWLDAELTKAEIVGARVDIDSSLEVVETTGLWQVTAIINGDFNPKHFNSFLLSIHKYPKTMTIEKLEVHQMERYSRFSLVLRTHFIISEES